jgi:Spy/CpxP family protein refolding chaperone
VTKWIVGAALLIVGTAPVGAQNPKPDDAFAQALFDPQLVLRHAEAIGLSQAQRRTILDEIKAAQTALGPMQVAMTEPAFTLIELLDETKVDEAKVIAATEKVLQIEYEVKKRQTALLVRIKNTLTQEQQSKLRELRRAEGAANRRGGEDVPSLPN